MLVDQGASLLLKPGSFLQTSQLRPNKKQYESGYDWILKSVLSTYYFQKELAIIYLSHPLFGLLALVVGTLNICTRYPSFESFAQTS